MMGIMMMPMSLTILTGRICNMSKVKAVKYDTNTNTYMVYYDTDNINSVHIGNKTYKNFKPSGNNSNKIISCRKK